MLVEGFFDLNVAILLQLDDLGRRRLNSKTFHGLDKFILVEFFVLVAVVRCDEASELCGEVLSLFYAEQCVLVRCKRFNDLILRNEVVTVDVQTAEGRADHCIILLGLRSNHCSLEFFKTDPSIEICIKLFDYSLHFDGTCSSFEHFAHRIKLE